MSGMPTEPTSYEEFMAQESPLQATVSRWREAARKNSNVYDPDEFYVSEELIEMVDGLVHGDHIKWFVLTIYRPPVAGLTDEDFKAYVKQVLTPPKESTSSRGGYYGYSSRYNFPGSKNWREELVAKRTPLAPTKYGAYVYPLTDVLETQFTVRKAPTEFAKEVNLLNDFLHSNFEGTFQEFLDLPRSAERERELELHVFKEYGNLRDVLSYSNHRHVGYFGPSAQKRTRTLLFEQKRPVWELIVAEAPKYAKGKTHQHTELFLQELNQRLDPTAPKKPKPLSEDELERAFTFLIAKAAATVREAYAPHRLFVLVKSGMNTIPERGLLKRYAQEYTEILELLEEVELDLDRAVCLLHALTSPRVWMRGGTDNAPYVLADLLRADPSASILGIIKEIVLSDHGMVPTEKEWRGSMETPAYDTAASWFLTITVKSEAKGRQPGPPEPVALLRQALN